MNKYEILEDSHEENQEVYDEREKLATGAASRAGMIVGASVCVLLVFISKPVLHIPEIALVGWLVYFTMMGSSNIVLYKELRNRSKLIRGIIEIALAVAFAAALVIKSVV